MLTQLVRMGLVFVLMVLVTGCTPPLEEFSPDGTFKVLIPGKPEDYTSSLLGVPIKTWAVTEKDGAYMVSLTELPKGLNLDGSMDQLLEKSTEGQAIQINGQITNKSHVMLSGKYPGRAVEGWIPSKNDSYRLRIYVVKSKIYQVFVLGKDSLVKSENATKFLDSLQILSE